MQVIKANKYKKTFPIHVTKFTSNHMPNITKTEEGSNNILPNNITVLSDICMMKTISRLHFNPSKNQKSKCQPEIKWKKKSQCVFSNAKIQENKDMQMVGFFSAAMLSTMEDDGISIPIRCPDRLNSF